MHSYFQIAIFGGIYLFTTLTFIEAIKRRDTAMAFATLTTLFATTGWVMSVLAD